MKLLTQAIYLSWEQKNPQNSENIEKHTPLNYTVSYKQNKVSFIFTSAGVMTGHSASLHHIGNMTLRPHRDCISQTQSSKWCSSNFIIIQQS